MVELSPSIAKQDDTCRLLPRSEEFSSLYINLTGLTEIDRFEAVGTLLDGGHPGPAWQLLRSASDGDPEAALIGAIAALQAGETGDAIRVLESIVTADELVEPFVDGGIVFAFSDEGMLHFDINSAAAVALLIFAYARDGRSDDAVQLAGLAFRATGAHAFLVLQLWLLRDAERWEELLRASEAADPEDRAQFEIDIVCARALEALGREGQALERYRRVAGLDVDFTWVHAARERLGDHGEEDGDDGCLAVQDEDDEETAWRYDPLSPPYETEPPTGGPTPTGAAPAGAVPRFSTMSLSLGLFLDGRVAVGAGASFHDDSPATTWLRLLDEESVGDVLDALDAAIAAGPPLVGLRRRPDPDHLQAKVWQRVLAALLSAAAGRADAPERLAAVLEDPECRPYVEAPDAWVSAIVTSVIGECAISTRGGVDALVLPLAARLNARGDAEPARAWVEWAASGRDSEALHCARVALAFRTEDDHEVLRLTDGLTGSDDGAAVQLTYRARSLQRLGRPEPALRVLGEVLRTTLRRDDASLATEVRYLRAHAALIAGRHGQAVDDLNAIEAVESDYLDVREMLEEGFRRRPAARPGISLEVKREVFQRDGGRCVQCGTDFDLQYDHIIPFSMGGSSNPENLQLLCGGCNRRKAATLG